jgi:hypothetical protein
MRSFFRHLSLALLAAAVLPACNGSDSPSAPNPSVGATDFTTEEPGSNNNSQRGEVATGAGGNGNAGGAFAAPSAADSGKAAAPAGRVADVQEADIYRIDNDHLFYLNTYRGFLIYDVTDPKNPQRMSRLPVYGYPVEMFVSGTTVYALLQNALYLTEVNGKLQFERHYVSQLVAIDVSDLHNPRVIKSIDITGELREGVSRKIDDTIYVVSYISQSYYWGWGYTHPSGQQKEQALVYSFDVSNPAAPKVVGQLRVFEGGSVQISDPQGAFSYNKNFSGVTISATSNALMVAENWYVYGYTSSVSKDGYYSCGTYENQQQSVVSLIDVSDPKGTIRLHTRFETQGSVADQFKMTYVSDEATKTGTFYGIFQRQEWSGSNCSGSSYVSNALESWDVTDGTNPTRLGSLKFGKPNETVRGTAFDTDRNVAYAITAQNMDPLYAISFADRKNLKVLSAVDGLSGDMSVFRLVGDKKFLLGIGRDTSSTCSGFQGTEERQGTKIAVSLIDVRDLNNVRLVQRQCVAVQNAEWVSSQLTWNQDQAHKMIGMFSDQTTNVVTVPVSYYVKNNPSDDWWWYRWQTAVGIMTWDLSKYDDTKPAAQQTVMQNYGTFIHPNGEVQRTIVFAHKSTGERLMINLSDTHASIASLQDLNNPKLLSVIEVAPNYTQLYRFGDYLVQSITSGSGYGYDGSAIEFRVVKAGGDLENAAAVASISVGQVQSVVKHGNKLVLFRRLDASKTSYYSGNATMEALVLDFSDPTHPQRTASIKLPSSVMPYYRYWCGWGDYWGGYWFNGGSNWTTVTSGLVSVSQDWVYQTSGDYSSGQYVTHLVFLDLSNPAAPTYKDIELGRNRDWGSYGLVADPVIPDGFYLTHRIADGTSSRDGLTFTRFRYYAQRWDRTGGTWLASADINLPGPLVRTWAPSKDVRLFLTQDSVYRYIKQPDGTSQYHNDVRLNLLGQVSKAGKPAAALLDSKVFTDAYLTSMVQEANNLYLTVQPTNYYWGYGGEIAVSTAGASAAAPSWEITSTRLAIFDLSAQRFGSVYDQPTKASGLNIMGTQKGRLFLNLSGDGILVVDVSNPAAPVGVQFLRTLGWGSSLEAAGDDIYVASGYFGIDHLSLSAPASIAIEP